MSGTSGSSSTAAATTSTSSTIAVLADSSGTDSVYIMQSCANGFFRDSITAASLPTTATSYLDSSYSGYTFLKAYEIKDSSGTIGGYVAIISFNGKPVGILFDANGNFVRVLEQRQAGDMGGQGWHHGGRYQNRDGGQRDTVALSALPADISSYLSSNYSSDTLLRAYINIDSSYLVITQDNGIFANVFTSTGTFVERVALTRTRTVVEAAAQSDLPATATSYLTTTYPDYVFDRGYVLVNGTTVEGYVVAIDANNTKYAVEFDGSGNLLAAITIH